jgi:uncharacterized membrane protein YccC
MTQADADHNHRVAWDVVWGALLGAVVWLVLTRIVTTQPWLFVVAVGVPVNLGGGISGWLRHRR